jgi:rhodanese-related sulfurtransferase
MIALIPSLISFGLHWKTLSVPVDLKSGEVTIPMALQMNPTVLWVDARTRKEFDQGHIPNAVLLNEDEWNELLPSITQVWVPERPIVVYCSKHCQSSEKVAQRLRESGLSPVYFLRGGWEAWNENTK